MAKLDKKTAKATNAAEGADFSPLPEAIYTATLRKVTVGESSNKNPMWTWEFEVDEPEEVDGVTTKGRKLFVNTALTDNALWKLKEVFNAFGYDADTDTDELIGEQVKLVVTQREIEKGARKGQIGNNINNVLALDAEEPEDDGNTF